VAETVAPEDIRAPWEHHPELATQPAESHAAEVSVAPETEQSAAPEQKDDEPEVGADKTNAMSADVAVAASDDAHLDTPESAADYQEEDYSQAFAAESESSNGDESGLDAEQFQGYDYISSLSEEDAKLAQSNVNLADLQPSIAQATGLAAEWQAVFAQLKLAGMTGSIAANCVLMEKSATAWLLHLDPNHSALFNNTQLQRISDAINAQLSAAIELTIEVHAIDQETPALALLRKQAKRQQEAETAIHTDPIVLQLIDTFGAIISAESIQPIDSVM
jgi:DNA polymerase-3 subunit gamma/tau